MFPYTHKYRDTHVYVYEHIGTKMHIHANITSIAPHSTIFSEFVGDLKMMMVIFT
jgi:hypothetical protein